MTPAQSEQECLQDSQVIAWSWVNCVFTTISFICFDIAFLWFSQRYLMIGITLQELSHKINARQATSKRLTVQICSWVLLIFNIASATIASVAYFGRIILANSSAWSILRIVFLSLQIVLWLVSETILFVAIY